MIASACGSEITPSFRAAAIRGNLSPRSCASLSVAVAWAGGAHRLPHPVDHPIRRRQPGLVQQVEPEPSELGFELTDRVHQSRQTLHRHRVRTERGGGVPQGSDGPLPRSTTVSLM